MTSHSKQSARGRGNMFVGSTQPSRYTLRFLGLDRTSYILSRRNVKQALLWIDIEALLYTSHTQHVQFSDFLTQPRLQHGKYKGPHILHKWLGEGSECSSKWFLTCDDERQGMYNARSI